MYNACVMVHERTRADAEGGPGMGTVVATVVRSAILAGGAP
jgi:hypothetical protein